LADWIKEVGSWMSRDPTTTARVVAKWYFDLIKNVFVVVALFYTSKKTDNAVVGIVAKFTSGMFFLYMLSYPLEIYYAIHTYSRSRSPLLSLLITTLAGIVLLGLVAATAFAATEVISALFNAQGSIK
jgi:hypothetical protein